MCIIYNLLVIWNRPDLLSDLITFILLGSAAFAMAVDLCGFKNFGIRCAKYAFAMISIGLISNALFMVVELSTYPPNLSAEVLLLISAVLLVAGTAVHKLYFVAHDKVTGLIKWQ